MSGPLRISIVTICRDNPEELAGTCASVDSQSLAPFEHVVVDGSTDGRIAAWFGGASQPRYRSCVSESDEGISDAFNKGVSRSTGDVVVMLNAGDRLHDDEVLARVAEAFGADPTLQWLHGSMRMRRGGLWVVIGKPFDARLLYRGMRSTFHPTMYVRRGLFDCHGGFDTSLRIAMDYDFLCRIAGERHAFLPQPLADFDPHGVSSTGYLRGLAEMQRVYRRHFGFSAAQWLWRWRQVALHRLLHSPLGRRLYAWKVRLGWANR